MVTIDRELYDYITDLLHGLGTPAHLKGHDLLRAAIVQAFNDPLLLDHMMNGLYTSVAQEFNTTPSRVERNIRAAVDATWDRGDQDVIYELFKSTISSKRGKAPNREFIMMIVDLLNRRFK